MSNLSRRKWLKTAALTTTLFAGASSASAKAFDPMPEKWDETFDVVISRNLTWTLPNAEHAYGEWMRVLKTGGVLLNFDANYGKDDASDTKDLPEQHAHFKVGNEMLEECERIKAQLPISRKNRPAYDVAVLCENTRGEIHIDPDLGKRIYLEKDEFYNPAPMFSICAVKK